MTKVSRREGKPKTMRVIRTTGRIILGVLKAKHN